MRCLYPRPVGFHADGKTISWSSKHYSKQYAPFQLPCGKCIECRLEYAREWAVRCVHEAQIHDDNCFITLTYSDENLNSAKLNYNDFQLFMKRLRDHVFNDWHNKNFPSGYYQSLSHGEKKQFRKEHKDAIEALKISVFVTGEYGEKTKRPHWHAILFNYRPSDCTYRYTTDRGDKVYTSPILDKIWGFNDPSTKPSEIGQVTFESAGYVARYAAKKLVHGNDQEHDFHPISKKSTGRAIGKSWLEKYWKDAFTLGRIILPNGESCSIPRYYEKWLKKELPQEWENYVTNKKLQIQTELSKKANLELARVSANNNQRADQKGLNYVPERTRSESRSVIINQKFKQLQQKLKL